MSWSTMATLAALAGIFAALAVWAAQEEPRLGGEILPPQPTQRIAE